MTNDVIYYSIKELESGLTLSELRAIPGLYEDYLDSFGTIDFTGYGWGFEEINNEIKRCSIVLALANEVRNRVEEKTAELTDDKNPCCQIIRDKDSEDLSTFVINYTAANNRFISV